MMRLRNTVVLHIAGMYPGRPQINVRNPDPDQVRFRYCWSYPDPWHLAMRSFSLGVKLESELIQIHRI
jgi:hypothetical protein